MRICHFIRIRLSKKKARENRVNLDKSSAKTKSRAKKQHLLKQSLIKRKTKQNKTTKLK